MGTMESDAVPDDVVARARAVFDQLGDPGELAPLVYDSLADGATSSERFWLVFQHQHAQLQITVSPSDGGWDLLGRLDPPSEMRAEVELDHSDVALIAESSEGRFAFAAVPPGVMRIGLTDLAGARLLQTDWFLIGAGSAP